MSRSYVGHEKAKTLNKYISTTPLLALLVLVGTADRYCEPPQDLPSPIRFEDVPALARERRAEIRAARERIAAAKQRESIVSALDNPEISASVDHWPWGMPEADYSAAIEQRFPISRIRGRQRREAQAETRRLSFEANRVTLDVEANAAASFLMLYERRGMKRILEEQKSLARQLLSAVNARYSSGGGVSQAEVIRAEIELSRMEADIKAIAAEIGAAEAMFNASLGHPADLPAPELVFSAETGSPPGPELTVTRALENRPELLGGEAEIERARAGIAIMRSMYWPMLMLRAGPSDTMMEGSGLMLMVSASLPIWRKKLRASVVEAEAMERMAKADLEAMKRMVEGEALSARNRVEAARVQYIAIRDDVLPRARQAIQPALSGYSVGLLPMVSVIEVLRMLWMTQEELLEAEVSLGSAWVRFGLAIGTLEGAVNE